LSETKQELLPKEAKIISKDELETLRWFLDPKNSEELKRLLQALSMVDRALEGQPIEPEDIFSGMLNIKDIRERTRYPSILDLKRHAYLRLLADKCPEASACKKWADEEAHSFISYPKGEGRKEGVEIMKAKGMIAQGVAPVFLGEIPTAQPKGRLSRLKERIRGTKEVEE